MCNDFGNSVPYIVYLEVFNLIGAPVVFPTVAPNLEPRDDIWPTETAPVFRRREHGVELVQLRWSFPAARPKAPPVINFRSEGRRFPNGRCLIPASHFFEFTGSKSPKSKWKFTRTGEEWFCFAGLWRPMPGGAGEAFTLLTPTQGPTWRPFTIGKWWFSIARIGSPGSISSGRNRNCFVRCHPARWPWSKSGDYAEASVIVHLILPKWLLVAHETPLLG